MATTTATHKQKLVQRLCTLTKGAAEGDANRPVLEHLLYAVCREGATRAQADKAFHQLQTRFFDWNEVRVSTEREVAQALRGLPDAEVRAFRILSLLQEIFETTYAFDLDGLHKKGLKQAQKQLERYHGATPFTVAYTLQQGLGGHALPLDAGMLRVLERLELLDRGADEAALASLEHAVPKAKGAAFCEALGEVALAHCQEALPRCPACPLHDLCPNSQARNGHLTNGEAAPPARARAKG
jgi:endonuclease-3